MLHEDETGQYFLERRGPPALAWRIYCAEKQAMPAWHSSVQQACRAAPGGWRIRSVLFGKARALGYFGKGANQTQESARR